MADADFPQFSTFKDCLAQRILAEPGVLNPAGSPDDPDGSPSGDSDALDDFTSYLAEEIWPALPASLRTATHETRDAVPDPDAVPLDSIPGAVGDTLVSCGLVPPAAPGDAADPHVDPEDAPLARFLRKVLRDYAAEACAPPPVWSRTRAAECEICGRAVPLTYHHLVPRSVHTKARKRKWHAEGMLNAVAWLCRPCHSAVHGVVASNEALAREYYTVELLLQREDIQKWRKYAAKQRWGIKRV
ncbi:uncharacterized protein BXZ73DRAFT_44453 [Epithele typhae]|uniref:uncharacterized protein n=1 Tax=Epithele typhae TaxID=378194 RepID=UPI00200769E1|nr:uncharacterized protein BXZ73DRAFT_44453 [Epithele typhae]KAH9938889.1 hypothetical protein BXZ73DRAFT_44453 [Epithele typhae]